MAHASSGAHAQNEKCTGWLPEGLMRQRGPIPDLCEGVKGSNPSPPFWGHPKDPIRFRGLCGLLRLGFYFCLGWSTGPMDVTEEHVVPWLALGLSMVLCLRAVGTACPHATLSPFWTCSAQELQDTFELFCEAGVDHLVAVILAEDRKGELPWRSLALCFSTLASVLKQELGRLRRSFAVEDLARRHERMIVRRFGALTTWCCLPTDMADRVLRLQVALRSTADSCPQGDMDIFSGELPWSQLGSADERSLPRSSPAESDEESAVLPDSPAPSTPPGVVHETVDFVDIYTPKKATRGSSSLPEASFETTNPAPYRLSLLLKPRLSCSAPASGHGTCGLGQPTSPEAASAAGTCFCVHAALHMCCSLGHHCALCSLPAAGLLF